MNTEIKQAENVNLYIPVVVLHYCTVAPEVKIINSSATHSVIKFNVLGQDEGAINV